MTEDFEYLYFFVQSPRYFFERQFEPQTGSAHSKGTKRTPPKEAVGALEGNGHKDWHKTTPVVDLPGGRNKRSVWTINTQSGGAAHYATYPTTLCSTPILASVPEFICSKCGEPRRRVYKASGGTIGKGSWADHSQDSERGRTQRTGSRSDHSDDDGTYKVDLVGLSDCGCDHDGVTNTQYPHGSNSNRLALLRQAARARGEEYTNPAQFVGLSECECAAPFKPGVILDIFGGTGTTAKEARALGRKAIDIDISDEYAPMAVAKVTATPNPFE